MTKTTIVINRIANTVAWSPWTRDRIMISDNAKIGTGLLAGVSESFRRIKI